MLKMLKIDQVHLRAVMLCMLKMSKMGKKHTHTFFVQGMWHVEDVGDVILIFFECNAIYVKDVEDRSNTPKGCNAMYIEDFKDGKRTYTYIFADNFLNI